jgi:flagellar hook-associated protein 2
MAENISVGGLASGLDTNGIIDGLVKVEQQRVTREETIQKNYQLKLDKFNELQGKLQSFADAADTLDDLKSLNLFSSTSSDSDVATITGESEATSGNYDLKVQSLATATKVASKSFAAYNTPLGASGTFSISTTAAAQKTDPLVTETTVSIAATDSLKDVVNKINRTKGAGASASIFQAGPGDFRLMLTSVEEGTRAFTLENTSGDPLGAAGLGIVNDVRALRTDFDFRLAAGGPATTATALVGTSLFNGIGANNAITAGDTISWTGTNANGGDASGSLVLGGAHTMADLLTSVSTAFGGPANVTVSLNSSGEIEIKDLTGGTSDFELAMSFTDGDASGSKLNLGEGVVKTDFTNVVSQGKKAFYLLNDLSMSSQSNKDSDTVVGTTFNLKKADPATSVKVTLTLDKEAIVKKIQEFLDQYNAVIKLIDDNSKVTVNQANKESSLLDQLSGKKSDDNKQTIDRGPFSNDSSIRSLRNQLATIMTGRIAELAEQGLSRYSSLASLGIVSNQQNGSLKVDEDTFKDAIDSDFDGIKRLFLTGGYSDKPEMTFGASTKDTKTGVYAVSTIANTLDKKKGAGDIAMAAGELSGENNILNGLTGDSKGLAIKFDAPVTGNFTFVRGISGQIKHWFDKMNNYVDGSLTQMSKQMKKYIDDQTLKIDEKQKRVDDFRTRMVNQFSQLEISISRLQSQQSAFNSQSSGFLRR